jgi:hypothetical protein
MEHAQAREILRQAWTNLHGSAPSEQQLAYAHAIALLETGYGRVGQFANMAAQGIFNWGALQKAMPAGGVCPMGTFPGKDTFQGQVVDVCFFGFPTDVEAAQSFLKTLTKSFAARSTAVLLAMHGTPEDVALAMKTPPAYYTDPAGKYAIAITNALRQIAAGGAGPSVSPTKAVALTAPLAGVAAFGLTLFVLSVGTAASYWLSERHRKSSRAAGAARSIGAWSSSRRRRS